MTVQVGDKAPEFALANGRGNVVALKDYLTFLTQSRSKEKRSVYIDSSDAKDRQVSAIYMLPMPVWKSSYRLVFTDQGQPTLEGWAIIDNTTADDWTNVRLAVVSGGPGSVVSGVPGSGAGGVPPPPRAPASGPVVLSVPPLFPASGWALAWAAVLAARALAQARASAASAASSRASARAVRSPAAAPLSRSR